MTKNKIAKIAKKAQENGNVKDAMAQQPLPNDFDPLTMLDAQLGQYATAQPLQINSFDNPYTQQAPVIKPAPFPGLMYYDTAADPENVLMQQLTAFNTNHTQLQPSSHPTVTVAPLSHVHLADQTVYHDVPGINFYKTVPEAQFDAALAGTVTHPVNNVWGNNEIVPALAPFDANAEIARHDRLLLLDWENLVDLNGGDDSADLNTVSLVSVEVDHTFSTEAAGVDGANYTYSMGGGEVDVSAFPNEYELDFSTQY